MDNIKAILMGNLPDWMPEANRVMFIHNRDALLRLHKLSEDEIGEQVAEVLEVHAENMADRLYVIHQEISRSAVGGKPVDEIVARREKMIRVMARVVQAVRLGPEAGLALLTDAEHAKTATIGAKNRIGQTKKAKLLRGKVGDEGETITEIITELATMREHRNCTAKEIWNPFISALEKRDLDPVENEANPDWKKWTICYDYKEGRKSITGGRFANVVYNARDNKKTR